MSVSADSLRLLLGVKLRALRQDQGKGLKEVAYDAGLSVSYLSEIEKGKKYPKPDKLFDLAAALGVGYDDLVSLQVTDELGGVKQAIASPLLREFPFELFGIEPEALVSLLASMPERASALVRALLEISRGYDARVEHFLFAALRAYQGLHGNYFGALEDAADAARADLRLDPRAPLPADTLREILETRYGYTLDTECLKTTPELQGLRSVFVPGDAPTLCVNPKLLPSQRAFIYARELGYERLQPPVRVTTSSWLKVEGFEQVLSNFRVSYFAGALLLPRAAVLKDLEAFFGQATWDENAFRDALDRYGVTPEMYFYRLSQLVPHRFGVGEIFFMRFHYGPDAGDGAFRLTKVLNLSSVPAPHGVRPDEHYCRRWPAMDALRALAASDREGPGADPEIRVQRSHFVDEDATFFVVSAARPLALKANVYSAVSVGFRTTTAFKRAVRFWKDPAVPTVEVSLTCERCPIPDCAVRAAPATTLAEAARLRAQEGALAELAASLKPPTPQPDA